MSKQDKANYTEWLTDGDAFSLPPMQLSVEEATELSSSLFPYFIGAVVVVFVAVSTAVVLF